METKTDEFALDPSLQIDLLDLGIRNDQSTVAALFSV
jgi:hypothetical protein